MQQVRILCIGDVGGHAHELYTELVRAGMDPESLELPAGLHVVQVGDLIHRGPDSPGVLSLVEQIRAQQPRSWTQLVGNHEAQYLDEPAFTWPERLDEAGEALLREWWSSGFMRHAQAVETAEGEVLLTHAGLTVGLWRELGRPQRAAEAAALLNALPGANPSPAWRAGRMLGEPTSQRAGVIWAEAGWEVYGPWLTAAQEGEEMPFHQVHGHSSAWWWSGGKSDAPLIVQRQIELDRRCRHVRLTVGRHWIRGIDAGLGRAAGVPWAPLELEGDIT